ncbi:MAG: hypothetical protein WDW38_009980 [Sanguina aurantia]
MFMTPICTPAPLCATASAHDNCITAASTQSIISGLPPIVKKDGGRVAAGGTGVSATATAATGGPGGVTSDGAGGGSGGAGGQGGGSGDGSSSSGGGGGSSSGGPHKMQTATYLFASAMLAGGAFAYVKKGSKESLRYGASLSFLLALCARSMTGPGAVGPARVAFALCLMLGVGMASRFSESKKFMPSGMVATLSLAMTAGFVAVGL